MSLSNLIADVEAIAELAPDHKDAVEKFVALVPKLETAIADLESVTDGVRDLIGAQPAEAVKPKEVAPTIEPVAPVAAPASAVTDYQPGVAVPVEPISTPDDEPTESETPADSDESPSTEVAPPLPPAAA